MIDELGIGDQKTLNKEITETDVKYRVLSNRFFSIWMTNNEKVWKGGEIVFPEHEIVFYHANFIIGVENKILLLNKFKNKFCN